MNERRYFLKVIGGSVVALGAGCGAGTGDGPSGTGAGGSGTGASGAGDATTTSAGISSSTGSTSTGSSGSTSGSTSATSSSSSVSGSSSGGGCPPAGTKLGQPGDYTGNGLHILAGQKVLIGRDAGGLYALTAICTHLQCNMDGDPQGNPLGDPKGTILASGIQCNCHFSQYDNSGAVVTGPAVNPLRAYALALGCDGFLYVDTATVVANTKRLMT